MYSPVGWVHCHEELPWGDVLGLQHCKVVSVKVALTWLSGPKVSQQDTELYQDDQTQGNTTSWSAYKINILWCLLRWRYKEFFFKLRSQTGKCHCTLQDIFNSSILVNAGLFTLLAADELSNMLGYVSMLARTWQCKLLNPKVLFIFFFLCHLLSLGFFCW